MAATPAVEMPHAGREDRAAFILDDCPTRVALAVALLTARDKGAPYAVHVVCGSAPAAASMASVLRRALQSVLPSPEAEALRRQGTSLVIGAQHVHLLELAGGHRDQDLFASVTATDQLVSLLRGIHASGLVVDAVAGPRGVLSALLLRGALETVATAEDRLYLLRASRRSTSRKRGRTAGRLVPVPHVPSARHQHRQEPRTFSDLRRRRMAAWRVDIMPEPLVVDAARGEARVGTVKVRLTPHQTFWYAVFASAPGSVLPLRAFATVSVDSAGQPHIGCDARDPEALAAGEWLRRMRALFGRLHPYSEDRFGAMVRRACALPDPNLRSTLAKIARALHDALGDAAERYCVRARRGEGYLLDLPAAEICVVLPPSLSALRKATA